MRIDTRSARLFITAAVLFAFAVAGTASAQPQLNFKRIVNGWPKIELFFTVACNGQPAYFTDKKYFRVYENGVEVTNFTLNCPNPLIPAPASVALVFDASGSMTGSGNAGAKAAGHAFVDTLDLPGDEAAVLWFNGTVTLAQSMTADHDSLHAAIAALPADGSTAVWDGCYAGLEELIGNSSNPVRTMIVLTDGGDNASTRSPAESISLANRNRIRIFTIGLGSGIQSEILKNIADLTGGRYYETPNASQRPPGMHHRVSGRMHGRRLPQGGSFHRRLLQRDRHEDEDLQGAEGHVHLRAAPPADRQSHLLRRR
ncbi:MAG: VWA domain-containing protein [Ignavibacteria bacterium]|nr:VWA domain-containing protein [Ignavibacteria bacterium]